MSKALQIVNLMLETQSVRVCASCENERGVKAKLPPGVHPSHGICRRHAVMGYEKEGLDPNDLNSRPDDHFAPEMQESEVRRCLDCERERYGQPQEGSHGQCKRHWLMWAQKQGFTPDQIAEVIREVEAGQGWPPDLGVGQEISTRT